MKIPRKYYLWLGLGLLLMMVFEHYKKQQVNWTPTLSTFDALPYGSEVLYEMAARGQWQDSIERINHSFYEQYALDSGSYTLIYLAANLPIDEASFEGLLQHIRKGNTALLIGNNLPASYLNDLGIQVDMKYNLHEEPEVYLGETYAFTDTLNQQVKDINYTLYSWDDSVTNVTTLGQRGGHANFLQIKLGKGQLLLHTTPLLFTNYYLVKDVSTAYVQEIFAMLPTERLVWDDFLNHGNRKSNSELRYVLASLPMRMAYYLLSITLLLFLIFTWKRPQKAVPVLEPLPNNSLSFIQTLSNLYLANRNNKIIARYLLKNFHVESKRRYFIQWNKPAAEIKKQLQQKSGKSAEEVDQLWETLQSCKKDKAISQQELLQLNKTIENFIDQ